VPLDRRVESSMATALRTRVVAMPACITHWHANLTDPADPYNDGHFYTLSSEASDAIRAHSATYWARFNRSSPFACSANASHFWNESEHIPPIKIWQPRSCVVPGNQMSLCRHLLAQPPNKRAILIVGESVAGQHAASLAEVLHASPTTNTHPAAPTDIHDVSICGGSARLMYRRSDLLDRGNQSVAKKWPQSAGTKYRSRPWLRSCPGRAGCRRDMVHICESWVEDAINASVVVLNTGSHWRVADGAAESVRHSLQYLCSIKPTPPVVILRTNTVGVADYQDWFYHLPLGSAAHGWDHMHAHPGPPAWGYLGYHSINEAVILEAPRAACPVDILDA